jgi:hypothetical protein
MNYDQNDCPTVFFHNPTFFDICRHTKNKSWRRCRLYFRGRMHCWWIFNFETDYTILLRLKSNYFNYLPLTLTMTSGTRKSGLHKQKVSVCFFSEQKWTYFKFKKVKCPEFFERQCILFLAKKYIQGD